MSDDSYREEEISAGALIIATGSIDEAERRIIKVLGLSQERAQDVVADASLMLIANAPPEIRRSFTAVCSYHRWNHLFEKAAQAHDSKTMMEAQKNIDALMRSVH
jgi:hypothetical protein